MSVNKPYKTLTYSDSSIVSSCDKFKVSVGANQIVGDDWNYEDAVRNIEILKDVHSSMWIVNANETQPTPDATVANCSAIGGECGGSNFQDVRGLCWHVPSMVEPPPPDCIEGAQKCEGNTGSTCIGGKWVETHSCGDIPPSCVEGEQRCEGNTGFTCIGGNWISTHSCGDTPPPTTELYEITLETNFAPELPSYVVGILRNAMFKGGWGLNNIRTTGNGYILQVEKSGSVTLIIILSILVAALALIGLIVYRKTAVRLSDNNRIIEAGATLSRDLENLNQMLRDGIIDQATYEQLYSAMLETYKDVIDPPDDDIFSKFTPFLVAGLAIAALSAVKK